MSHRSFAQRLFLLAAALLLVARPLPDGLDPAAAILAAAPWAALLAGGLVAGYLAGLLGIGGALVTMPALYAALPALGVPAEARAQAAVLAALVAMIPTTFAAARSHHRNGALVGSALRMLAPALVAGALAGALLAGQVQGPVLMLVFAAQGLYVGVRLCGRPVTEPTLRSAPFLVLGSRTPGWLFGSLVGGLCASIGMGCGSMAAPYLCSRGLDLRRAVATASALNLVMASAGIATILTGAASAAPGGGLPWQTACLAGLLVGGAAMVAAPRGVAAARRLPDARFQQGVGAVNVAGALAVAAQVAAGA